MCRSEEKIHAGYTVIELGHVISDTDRFPLFSITFTHHQTCMASDPACNLRVIDDGRGSVNTFKRRGGAHRRRNRTRNAFKRLHNLDTSVRGIGSYRSFDSHIIRDYIWSGSTVYLTKGQYAHFIWWDFTTDNSLRSRNYLGNSSYRIDCHVRHSPMTSFAMNGKAKLVGASKNR